MEWPDLSKLPKSAWLLLGANLVPLVCVLALGWDLGTIMLLFWAENAIVGFYHILRLALVARWYALFLVPFFTLHFGIFTLVHGVFVLVLFVEGEPAAVARVALPGILALAVSHGASFVTNFLGSEMARMREAVASVRMRKTGPNEWSADVPEGPMSAERVRGFLDVGTLMTAPYRRLVVLHVTIIVGGMLAMFLGAPVLALVVLVVLKTAVDVFAHLRERRRAGAGTAKA